MGLPASGPGRHRVHRLLEHRQSAGVAVRDVGFSAALSPIALGTALGLFLGKPIGITLFTLAAVKLRMSSLPRGASWSKLVGVSIVAGIGFTVALFIAALAFPNADHALDEAKLGILLGSFAAGVVGYALLRFTDSHAVDTTNEALRTDASSAEARGSSSS